MKKDAVLSMKNQRIVLCIMGIIIIGLQLKLVLTELNVDTEYAIAMSWRMMQGDFMFSQMWEPHQTSAFLLAWIMKIYVMITGTNEGIVLYINCVGAMIHGLVAWSIYHTLKDKVEPFFLKLLCMFFMTLHPKWFVSVTPEFTNMIIWFSVLLFLCLYKYYSDQRKKGWLVLASMCLCLQILSYPSSIVVFFGITIIFFLFSNNKWSDILLFSLGCAIQGIAYVSFFMVNIGVKEFLENISCIVRGDSYHTEGANIYGGLMNGIPQVAIWLGSCFVASYAWKLIGKLLGRKTVSVFYIFSLIAFCTEIIMAVFFWYNGHDTSRFNMYLLVLALYSCRGIRYLDNVEKRIVTIAYAIAVGSIAGVCFLTNLSFTYVFGYGILGFVIAFIPIKKLWENKGVPKLNIYFFLLMAVCIGIFRGVVSIRECEGIITKGPAKGIILEYMDVQKNNSHVEDWEKFVEDGDSVLIVGENSINALGYILGNTTMSIHSTMCGPTYNEVLLTYWEKNPERYPDVIAVQCWDSGDISVNKNSWIMQWIANEYQPNLYENGRFYRFYRLKKE